MKKRGPGRPKMSKAKFGQLIHLRLPPAVYRALKAEATRDDRSLTATVTRILTAHTQKGDTTA